MEIDTPGKSIDLVIGTIYRHLGANFHTFLEELCSTLGQLADDKREYIICGDINIDLLQYQLKAPITNYVNFIYLEGCYNLIDKPTRITDNFSTIIDHIYINIFDKPLDSGILSYDISDRLPVYCLLGSALLEIVSQS